MKQYAVLFLLLTGCASNDTLYLAAEKWDTKPKVMTEAKANELGYVKFRRAYSIDYELGNFEMHKEESPK